MMYYIIVTDINTRQYIFQIFENGLDVAVQTKKITITQQDPKLLELLEMMSTQQNFILDNTTIFISQNLSSIEYKVISNDGCI